MLRRRRQWIVLGVLLVALGAWLTRNTCIRTGLAKGVWLNECADGELRPVATLEAPMIRRGQSARLVVSAEARYTLGSADELRSAPVSRFDPTVTLVDKDGHETALVPEKGWRNEGGEGHRVGDVAFPKVADGDYRLRAKVHCALGDATVEAPLALYAPARVHVLTDRPLYEPGNTLKFRAVLLRARDLAPLDGRPGTWTVVDPSGETVLEEKVPAGDWGVTSGSFPLDAGAPEGSWHVRYSSGGAFDDVSVEVHPFTLPRFRVEAATARPFHRIGDKPVVKGSVVYSSGAPVAKAEVEVQWEASGAWPPPTEWLEKTLPRHATTDQTGHFTLDLPAVPSDLRGQATLTAHLAAIDPAGDRVEGAASVLLSEDALQLSAVSELPDGLVGGFNNRLFLRVSDAAGSVLAGAAIHVKRAWDPADKGQDATCDEDGVAALQLDPGPAVNVVIPPMPVRLPPKQQVASRHDLEELLDGGDASLADQRALDGWLALIEPCGRFVDGSDNLTLGLRVDRSGALVGLVGAEGPLSSCVVAAVRGLRLPAGKERLYRAGFGFQQPDLASLSGSTSGVPVTPDGLEDVLHVASMDVRSCLPEDVQGGALPRQLTWRVRKGSKEIGTAWAPSSAGGRLPAAATACVEKRFERLALPEDADVDALGTVHFDVSPSERVQQERPEATTMLGYELVVSAKTGGKDAGSTKLRMGEGRVPPIRLRATPVLAKAGETVNVEILRGPDFHGELPKKLWLQSARGQSVEADVDVVKRTVAFKLMDAADGWFNVQFAGAEVRVFVRPKSELSLAVKPDKERYAPGEIARIAVQTSSGGRGQPAAVGLFGVDDSLGQLAKLSGPDDFARVRPKVPMVMTAFEGLDAQALTLGRVRGANAAAAIVSRVGMPEGPADLDAITSARAAGLFDPSAELVDRFYGVLGELHGVVRDWEEKAPEADQMHPPKMAELWKRALTAAQLKGLAVTDAYGRRLRLSQLPPDLLALVDPRAVVVTGTRLPEDVENWPEWVAKERP